MEGWLASFLKYYYSRPVFRSINDRWPISSVYLPMPLVNGYWDLLVPPFIRVWTTRAVSSNLVVKLAILFASSRTFRAWSLSTVQEVLRGSQWYVSERERSGEQKHNAPNNASCHLSLRDRCIFPSLRQKVTRRNCFDDKTSLQNTDKCRKGSWHPHAFYAFYPRPPHRHLPEREYNQRKYIAKLSIILDKLLATKGRFFAVKKKEKSSSAAPWGLTNMLKFFDCPSLIH